MNEYMYYYIIGEFAAEQMLKGHIQPDFKIENIGIEEYDLVFVDYADMFVRKIPDVLDENLPRQLTESLFSLVRSIDNYKYISIMRAGFTARGGILADIIWHNMANRGFTSLSYNGILDKELDYSAIDELTLEITTKQIIQWKEINFNKVKIGTYHTLYAYSDSDLRKETSSISRFYLDRLYYSRCYNKLNEKDSDEDPILIMNMGMSAFRNNKKYSAFGLLSKCVDMSKNNFMINKMCTNTLNKLRHTKRLSPALKNLILDYIDLELFELLWILDDVDAFEHQLSEI